MARPSKRKRGRADLACNNCGRRFRGLVWLVSIETSDLGTADWALDDNPTRDARCPRWGRRMARVIDE